MKNKFTYIQKRVFFASGLFAILFTMLSCGLFETQDIQIEQSTIINNSCSPPCWMNITPGVTTKNEVVDKLNNLHWIRKESVEEFSVITSNDSIMWEGIPRSSDASGYIFFYNDVVTLINIDSKPSAIKFSNLIEELGEPELIFSFYSLVEKTTISIWALYPTLGIGFSSSFQTLPKNYINQIEVSPELEVNHVWYCEPKKYIYFLTSGPIGYFSNSFLNNSFNQWVGYGEYKSVNIWDDISPEN